MTFPAHQGLILPIMRRWPNSFDALALSVGAAMPDITDTCLGFLLNGYFKQWYGHALVGIFTVDLLGGLLIMYFIVACLRWFVKYTALLPSNGALAARGDKILRGPGRFSVWTFSLMVGIFSHVGFDLISHDTNLLLYPWVENARWFPGWWYRTWFEIHPLPMFGPPYAVGVFSIIWCILTIVGILWFFQFLRPKQENKV
jgi:hypothetical protein